MDDRTDRTNPNDTSTFNNNNAIVLKLGDVIRIHAPQDSSADGRTYLIDYIDETKLKLIDIETGNAKTYLISPTGTIGDGSIQTIDLLSSNPEPGFARQNGLLPGKWANIYFGGDIPFILVGTVTDLEEDMIEFKSVDGETYYIDFKYSGIPEDLQIEAIELRDGAPAPAAAADAATAALDAADGVATAAPDANAVMGALEDIPEDEEERIMTAIATVAPTVPARPAATAAPPVRTGIQIDMGDLEFGDDFKVEEMVAVSRDKYRYSLESQTNDMLEELLALVPSAQRNATTLNRIHTNINRFVQLRALTSQLDEHQNVMSVNRVDTAYKPLAEYLNAFGEPLAWIRPVVCEVSHLFEKEAGKGRKLAQPGSQLGVGVDAAGEEEAGTVGGVLAVTTQRGGGGGGGDDADMEYGDGDGGDEGEGGETQQNPAYLIQRSVTYVNDLTTAANNYRGKQYNNDVQSAYLNYLREFLAYLRPYSGPTQTPASDTFFKNKFILEQYVKSRYPVMIDNSATGTELTAFSIENGAVMAVPTRFRTAQYATGYQHLVADNLRGSAFRAHRANLTNNDTVAVRAMVFLPRQVQQYTRWTLPTTSIYERARCNAFEFQEWRLFTDDRDFRGLPPAPTSDFVNTITLNRLETDLKYDTEVWLERFVHLTLDENFMQAATSPEEAVRLYRDYLRTIIPNTSFLVQCVQQKLKKTNKHCLSYVQWVDELAPYQVDLNTMHRDAGTRVAQFLKTSIGEFLNQFRMRNTNFATLKHMRFPTMRTNQDGAYLFSNTLIQAIQGPADGASKEGAGLREFMDMLQKKADQYGHAAGVSMRLEEIMSNYFPIGGAFTLTDTIYSPAELLQRMMSMDFGNVFHAYIALTCLSLIVPHDLQKLLQADMMKLTGKKELDKRAAKNSDCKPHIVAKKYRSVQAMQADNNKAVIYFDKEYDKTPYDVLEERYGGMRSRMEKDKLKEYVKQDLQNKAKMTSAMADDMAEAFILQAKRVREGHYAIVSNADPATREIGTMEYYIRNGDVWAEVMDGEVMREGMAIEDNDMLCDLNIKCIFNETETNESAQCSTNELSADRLKEITLKSMMNQYDNKFQEKYDEVEKREFSLFLKYVHEFSRINALQQKQTWKYVTEKYNMGLSVQNSGAGEGAAAALLTVSPYAKLRDMILGQNDFVKRQNDIVRFANLYCREGNPELPNVHDGQMENKWWMYCKKTDVKLLPLFRYKLAYTFVTFRSNYEAVVAELIQEIGKLGDEGDAWVDVNSGEIISYINFDTTEGFTEGGFVDKTRDVLDTDALDLLEQKRGLGLASGAESSAEGVVVGVGVEERKEEMAKAAAMQKRLSKEGQMIYSVVSTVATNMGIVLDDKLDWIIKIVTDKMADPSVIEKEAAYKLREEAAARSGKKLPAYSLVYFTTLFYITLGALLIAIQTSIPSIKTKKTFPGCVRSFVGFPLDGTGDASALDYLACVVVKLRDGKTAPWNIVPKKAEDIASKTRIFIVKFLLPSAEIDHAIKTKITYLMTTQDDNAVPEEYAVERWSQFLPPLRRFHVEHVPTLSESFSSMLQSNLASGSPTQFKQIMSIQAGIQGHALAMQEAIQNIVDKKTMLLKSGVVPFVDNACCNESESGAEMQTTLEYFVKENPNIRMHVAQMVRLEKMQTDLTALTRATMFMSTVNTKRPMTQLSKEWSEETIYLGFIHFCKFQSTMPLSEQLAAVCVDKPEVMLRKTDSLQDRIARLKRENRMYTKEQFVRLFQVVCRQNRVPMSFVYSQPSMVQEMRDTLAVMDAENVPTEQVPSTLRTHLNALLDTFEISITRDTPQMRQMKNYLDAANQNMRDRILTFVENNRHAFAGYGMKFKNVKQGMRDLMKWRSDSLATVPAGGVGTSDGTIQSDGLYMKLQFMKNSIANVTNIYPSQVLRMLNSGNMPTGRSGGYAEYTIQMKVSDFHVNEITNIRQEDLAPFFSFINLVGENATLTALIQMVMENNYYVKRLAEVTPILSSFLINNTEHYSVFEKSLVSMLYEYYFLMAMFAFVQQSEDIVGVLERERAEKSLRALGAAEGSGSAKRRNATEEGGVVNDMSDVTGTGYVYNDERDDLFDSEETEYGNTGKKPTLQRHTALMLMLFMEKVLSTKKDVDVTVDFIKDKVFRSKEAEKYDFTDRLKNMSDELRAVDTIMKVHKIGDIYSIGLSKGLRQYDAETYERDKQLAERVYTIQNKVARERGGDANDGDVLDAIQEMETDELVARDNLINPTDDFFSGDPWGDELEPDDLPDYD